MLLRTIPSARRIPVSVEWSLPFGGVQTFTSAFTIYPRAAPSMDATSRAVHRQPEGNLAQTMLREIAR